jgi:hypothetical protein
MGLCSRQLLVHVSTVGGTDRIVQGQQGIYTHWDALWHSFESQAIRSLWSSLSNNNHLPTPSRCHPVLRASHQPQLRSTSLNTFTSAAITSWASSPAPEANGLGTSALKLKTYAARNAEVVFPTMSPSTRAKALPLLPAHRLRPLRPRHSAALLRASVHPHGSETETSRWVAQLLHPTAGSELTPAASTAQRTPAPDLHRLASRRNICASQRWLGQRPWLAAASVTRGSTAMAVQTPSCMVRSQLFNCPFTLWDIRDLPS